MASAEKPREVPPPAWIMRVRLTLLNRAPSRVRAWALDGLGVLCPLELARAADVGDEPGEGRARRDERQVDGEVLLPAFLLAVGLVDRAELLGLPLLGALFDPGLDAVPSFSLRRCLVVGRSLGGRAEDEVVLPAQLLGRFHAEGAGQEGFFERDLGFRPDRMDDRGQHVAESWA